MSTAVVPAELTLAEFGEAVETWLRERYQPAATDTYREFVWGQGSDVLRMFPDPDPDEEQRELDAVRRWRRAAWDTGLGWLTGPTQYGGAGVGASYQREFDRRARRYAVPGDSQLTVSLGMVAPTLQRHGSEDQRLRWLPGMYRGDIVACQLFSEPEAGSDLASVRTKAERTDGTWRISGQKVWTSGAHLADVGLLLARTSDGPRHGNLTMFVVDMRAPGVDVRPLRQMTGGASFNEVFLDDLEVDDGDRVAEVGEGWAVAMTTLANERNSIGHSAFGGAALLSTDRLIGLVRASGRADDPHVQSAFAELISQLRMARYAREIVAARARAGDPPGAEIALHKIALSENIRRLGEFATEVLGPKAVLETGEWGTFAWSDVLLAAPGYRIGGGTDEVLKNTVAKRALGLPVAR